MAIPHLLLLPQLTSAPSVNTITVGTDSASMSTVNIGADISAKADKDIPFKRANILHELIKTEGTLACYFAAVVTVFLPADDSKSAECPLTTDDVAAIIPNIQAVASVSTETAERFAAAATPEVIAAEADIVGAVNLSMVRRPYCFAVESRS